VLARWASPCSCTLLREQLVRSLPPACYIYHTSLCSTLHHSLSIHSPYFLEATNLTFPAQYTRGAQSLSAWVTSKLCPSRQEGSSGVAPGSRDQVSRDHKSYAQSRIASCAVLKFFKASTGLRVRVTVQHVPACATLYHSTSPILYTIPRLRLSTDAVRVIRWQRQPALPV
jgi:hypothetical protein